MITVTHQEARILRWLETDCWRSWRVLSRAALGIDLDDSAHNLVRVHIHNIRRKFGHAAVISMQGPGYRLAAPLEWIER